MIENPTWEQIKLKNFLVIDGVTTIVAYKPEHGGVDRMDLQVVGKSVESTKNHYIVLSENEYNSGYNEVTVMYDQENYIMKNGEIVELTEEDKKPWYLKD